MLVKLLYGDKKLEVNIKDENILDIIDDLIDYRIQDIHPIYLPLY